MDQFLIREKRGQNSTRRHSSYLKYCCQIYETRKTTWEKLPEAGIRLDTRFWCCATGNREADGYRRNKFTSLTRIRYENTLDLFHVSLLILL